MEIRLIRKEKEYRLTRDGKKLVLRSAEKERIYDVYTLRGVSVQGFCIGDLLILYSGEGKQKYELAEDCAPETVDKLFEGVKRFQVKKRAANSVESSKPDWRREMQEPETLKRMLRIGSVLNVAGWICTLLTMLIGRREAVYAVLCTLTMLVSLGMCMVYPQYFSVLDDREYRRAGYTAKVAHVGIGGMMLPALALLIRTMRDYYFFDWTPLIWAGVTAGVAAALIFALLREMRENPRLLAGVFLAAAAAFAGLTGQVNHLANFGAEPPGIYTVEDRDIHRGRRGMSYYCMVELEDGETIRLPIGGGTYHKLERGDNVLVYIGEGALGIEYAYYVGNLNGK